MILTTLVAHQRKLIRQAVVALLIGANTAAGSRVKATRVEPHKKSQLPAIAVYTLSEESNDKQTAPVELTRELKLEITGWVVHSDDYQVDDRMDDLAEQIEAAMASDYYLAGADARPEAGTAAEQMLESTEMQVVEDDGRSDPLVGIVTLTYSITYRTVQGATATDGLATIVATTQLVGGVSDTAPAIDQITEDQ